MTQFNVRLATMRELIDFFNANTGGNPVKKFADRPTAEKRVQKLIDEINAEKFAAEPEDTSTVHAYEHHGFIHCPNCGAHLSNGVGEHMQEVNGKFIKHDSLQYECLACGTEFGPEIQKSSAKPVKSVGPRPAMSESLKLDRQIVDCDTNIIYKNACRVWKAGLVSSAQCDRLSATLYGAAKRGDRSIAVTINNHNFELAVK